MTKSKHKVVWFDIPVKDIDRSIKFYSAILGAPVHKDSHGDMQMGILPHQDDEVAGCLAPADADNQPSQHGPLIYLNCDGRLDDAIAAVEPNGGKVLKPKHAIGPYGSRAVVLDSEGNRVALHST